MEEYTRLKADSFHVEESVDSEEVATDISPQLEVADSHWHAFS